MRLLIWADWPSTHLAYTRREHGDGMSGRSATSAAGTWALSQSETPWRGSCAGERRLYLSRAERPLPNDPPNLCD
jgi:hypothetical protein